MTEVAFSLGSNIGDRFAYITKMEHALNDILKEPVVCSSIMETEPLGVNGVQQWYLNRVVYGFFEGDAEDLLVKTASIEKFLGRIEKNLLTPRTADIDILLYGKNKIDTGQLKIPHPSICQRRFCLEGLNQIVPQWVVPGADVAVNYLYRNMDPLVRIQKIRFLN